MADDIEGAEGANGGDRASSGGRADGGSPLPKWPIEVGFEGRTRLFAPGKDVVIGRSPAADVVIGDPHVDAEHVLLSTVGETWRLIDPGSRNGTWLNGKRVATIAIVAPVTVVLGPPEGGTSVTLSLRTDAHPPAADLPEHPGNRTVLIGAGSTGVAGGPFAPFPGAERGRSMDATVVPPAQAGPGTPTAAGPGSSRQRGPGPVLIVRLGTRQHFFPVGSRVRIGRDPSLEVVSENPLVSRQTHGFLSADAAGATYTDTSSRGTFLEGKRLSKPLRITESVTLRLGDPATGEELGVTPPLNSGQLEHNRVRKAKGRRARLVAAVGGVLAVAILAGVAAVAVSRRRTGPVPAKLSPAALAEAKRATVRLLGGSTTDFMYSGSGTIISPDGLILTNAHVASPGAPGLAVATGAPAGALGPNPPFLTVELTTGDALAAVARYRATPVAVDGYLDLAVVRITSDADGKPVTPSSLGLPFLSVGDASTLQLDQNLTVLGFPGVTQSNSLTVTSGGLSTFIADPLHHVPDPRFELETTARVAHGNSGGAAIDDAGRLIGVPSLAIPGEGSDVSWRLRSADLAKPLISAARSGSPYQSPWLKALSGREMASLGGWAASPQAACNGSSHLSSGAADIAVGFQVDQIPQGLDLAVLIHLPGGGFYKTIQGMLPQATYGGGSCVFFGIHAHDLGLNSLPNGDYRVRLLGGPDLEPISPPATAVVGGT